MHPKITIEYSYYLQIRFLRSACNFKKLDKFTRKFKEYFKTYEELIMSNIPKYTGLKWKQKNIKAWIFDGYQYSFSTPLLLNSYGYKKELVLFTLIHELIHNNISSANLKKFNTMELKELEAIVELITKNVAKHIFNKKHLEKICKWSEAYGSYRKVWERERELEVIMNLERKPLINWLL